jgi:elongation factor G
MAYSTDSIRNIALTGNSGGGKTTLLEAILQAGGTIKSRGSVERGDTVSDFDPRERQLQHSLNPAVCHLDHGGIHINVIDTPGARDFYGRSLSVLAAVETAAIVIDASVGVDPMAQQLMEVTAERGLCRMIVVNKIDAESVNLARVFDEIQTTFGPNCLPINLPADNAGRVVDCFFEVSDTNPDFDTMESAHAKIIDQVVEVDEELMELYLEQGENITPEQLHEPFEKALRDGHLVPVCFVSARTGTGVTELLEILERLMPNPTEGNPPMFLNGEGQAAKAVNVVPDPNAHVLAHVFKVDVDPFRGRLGILRIHQGTIHVGDRLFVGDARKTMKVTHLLKVNGSSQVEISRGIPGDICAIPRAEHVFFDAVLHDSHDEDEFHLKSIELPVPIYGRAMRTRSDADAQKVADALHTLQAEDPSFRVEHVASLNETVLWGLSDLHLREVVDEIESRHNVQIETADPTIAYRETITTDTEGHHRHKKQTGGAGQFGEVFLRVEPLTRGSGFEFANKVVGGSIPIQFIPAVEKGIRQVLETGAISGHPLQDIRVTVYEGKHHSVDSKEVAFFQAGRKAFLDAVLKAEPIVLEPIVDVKIAVPSECMGAVAGDLASMDGIVNGTNVLPDNTAEISGQVPLRALQSYHSRLKSLSGGDGTFTMAFSHYTQVEAGLQDELMTSFKPTDDE